MKAEATPESPEMIEIIDDDVDMFGERSANATIHDTGGPRWIGPVAAVALVALIGYGVATSASRSSVPKVAPAPNTTVAATTTTTQPAPTTTAVPKPLVPFYAADPPLGLTVQYADTQEPDANEGGPGFYQLWATDDASASTGSWFSAETFPGSVSNVFALDAYRVQSGDRVIAIAHLPGGQSSAAFASGTSYTVNLVSFGFTDAALIQLAESINVARSHIQYSDRELISNFRMLSTVPPFFALQGNPAEQIYYTDGNDPFGGVGITVSPRSASTIGGSTLDRQTSIRFFLNDFTQFDVDGHVAVAGEVVGQQGYAMATWIAADHIVTVAGVMPVPDLIAFAQTVHQVSAERWAGMQYEASLHSADNNFGNYEQTDPKPVAFGTYADGEVWTIKASIATFGDDRQVNWEWAGNGNGTRVDDTAKISTMVDTKRTYVLADLPRALAPTAQLQILRDGFDPVLVSFTDTDPNIDRTFSAYSFSEPASYTAQIIGTDGSVLASWPSS